MLPHAEANARSIQINSGDALLRHQATSAYAGAALDQATQCDQKSLLATNFSAARVSPDFEGASVHHH
ncbi:hypothetical protein LTR15_002136 [Elasticomyces elasticus]|nr:hypothetical protein LTR15_002136 [Elasticomyces elasticus]